MQAERNVQQRSDAAKKSFGDNVQASETECIRARKK